MYTSEKILIIIVSCMFQAKGRPTEETRIQLKCSDSILQKILQLRKDFAIHDNTKMLVMISISTKDMNRFVSMHPSVWFIDCTAGEFV
jgi:hypothetical protein